MKIWGRVKDEDLINLIFSNLHILLWVKRLIKVCGAALITSWCGMEVSAQRLYILSKEKNTRRTITLSPCSWFLSYPLDPTRYSSWIDSVSEWNASIKEDWTNHSGAHADRWQVVFSRGWQHNTSIIHEIYSNPTTLYSWCVNTI